MADPMRWLRWKALKTPLGQRILAPFGSGLSPERWIFLVGCYNSGTTLLRSLLSQHRDIAALPSEGVKLTDALPQPEDFGWHRMWCECREQMRLATGPAGERTAQRIARHWSHVVSTGAPSILEKSIANTARMPFFQAHFSPAHFVCLVRSGYAVCEGLRRKGDPARHGNTRFPDGYPIDLCARQWKVSDEVVEADRPGLERFLQIRYEDLVGEPVDVLRQITDFLGLSPLAEDAATGEWLVHGTRSPIRDMNQQSIERLSPQDVDEINRVAGHVLARHGYELR